MGGRGSGSYHEEIELVASAVRVAARERLGFGLCLASAVRVAARERLGSGLTFL